ncbi:MAG: hypothetical protein WC453_03500 [Patescibacteria group bacterium]
MSTLFLIFTDRLIKRFSLKDQHMFFREVIAARYGTIFMPDEGEDPLRNMDSIIIQLSLPVYIKRYQGELPPDPVYVNADSAKYQGKLSLDALEQQIKFREVKIEKAVVLGTDESEFQDFDESFDFIIVNPDRDPGFHGQYQVVNQLPDSLLVISSFESHVKN